LVLYFAYLIQDKNWCKNIICIPPEKERVEYYDRYTGSVCFASGISVESAVLGDGHTICAGDVVWAQDGQLSTWPAKVFF
jgi:hypothetical protein